MSNCQFNNNSAVVNIGFEKNKITKKKYNYYIKHNTKNQGIKIHVYFNTLANIWFKLIIITK